MTARSDCEELMGALVPFAEKMLREYGEFYPYGGALTSGGAVEMAAGFDGTDRPPSADLIRLIKEGLTIGAAAGAVSRDRGRPRRASPEAVGRADE
jgi:hypothetical protein